MNCPQNDNVLKTILIKFIDRTNSKNDKRWRHGTISNARA